MEVPKEVLQEIKKAGTELLNLRNELAGLKENRRKFLENRLRDETELLAGLRKEQKEAHDSVASLFEEAKQLSETIQEVSLSAESLIGEIKDCHELLEQEAVKNSKQLEEQKKLLQEANEKMLYEKGILEQEKKSFKQKEVYIANISKQLKAQLHTNKL